MAGLAQANDLAVSGAITDAKGDRKNAPPQDDIDTLVHLVEKTGRRDCGAGDQGQPERRLGSMKPWCFPAAP